MNNELMNKIIKDDFMANMLSEMTADELHPEVNEELKKEIKIRQEQKSISKVSRTYYCRKCKNNETIIVEYQARAADECSSQSIKCIHCGFVWRT